ncbi:UDP-N-acetylglucosamine 2-epimerase [Dyadobacter sp. MSC1_007]|jgi:UDP-hydrolysing UDP-N-acetyl-D-glucosamine 2-epimerase|uniref:UDP-N-acetylglucosamine 2-epimerase n=1 Tax=Dyadobacter sp. MSC1_007 TaxID=2909264 RepID=UPI002030405C|nr:UDP-N-acetylglucosamine 2-epimerase [Dyadobacter sp. MSC1_007]
MRKICVVVTARASYSRIRTVLTAICAHPFLELQLVITSSALLDRFGNIIPMLEKDRFEVSAKIANLLDVEDRTASAKTTGLAAIELATFFGNHRPDIVVTIADRFETIATAITAVNMNIPLAHIQGGEITGNVDDRIRNSVTQLADIHFTATETARQRIISMGIPAEKVHYTGCPSIDLIHERRREAFNPYAIYGGVGAMPDLIGPYLIVVQHPVTTEACHSRWQIENTLKAVEILQIPSLWFWPNADPGTFGTSEGINVFRERGNKAPIHFFRNMESGHFIQLLRKCACLVGNSSVGIREGSSLGLPVVNIGSRQRGRERGPNVIDTRPETAAIASAVQQQLAHGPYTPTHVYGNGYAGEAIATHLASVPLIIKKHCNLTSS